EPTLAVDLMTIAARGGLPEVVTVTRRVTRAGRLDGWAVFFEVIDVGGAPGESLKLSSSPVDAGRAPHWAFRILRTDTEMLAAGDVVTLELEVGRWDDPDSWHWTVDVERARALSASSVRSEERRGGKEGGSRGAV